MQVEKSIYCDAYNNLCLDILSHKSVLAFIMKECLDEYKDLSIEEIITCIEKDISNGSDRILGFTNDLQEIDFDVFFGAALPHRDSSIGMLINLEAQRNTKSLGYKVNNRALLYEGYELVYQYGRFIKNQEYDQLRKAVLAWICFEAPTKEEENSISYFHLTKDMKIGYNKIEPDEYDKILIIIIYLGETDTPNKLLRYLRTLFTNRISYEEKIRIFEEEFQLSIDEAFKKEVNDMCDLASKIQDEGIKIGMTQGLEQGLAQGLSQGLAQGLKQATLQHIRNLMENSSCTMDEAFAVLDVDIETQELIRQNLNQENNGM